MTISFSKTMAATMAVFLFSASLALAAPLSAPSNLGAVTQSASAIDLTWTDNASKEAGFEVERSSDGSNYSVIDTVGANVESYSDSGLSSETTYYYRVRAYNVKRNGSVNYGGYSNVDSDTTLGVVPNAPTSLQTAASSSAVSLSWADNSDNETGFEIERSTDGVNFTNLDSTAANTVFYTDTAVSEGVTYYYRVYAVNATGNSAFSNVASDTVPVSTPAAPSSLFAFSASSTVYLSWTDNASNEDGFSVERSTDGVNFSVLATVGTNMSFYDDFSVTTGTTYYYRVQATNTGGSSAYSNTESVLVN